MTRFRFLLPLLLALATLTPLFAPTPAQAIPTPKTWYKDMDHDAFGDPDVYRVARLKPAGYVLDNTDCNDANRYINPMAVEYCDGLDNDCNHLIDDSDYDFDGYYSEDCGVGDDCDDFNSDVHPDAWEYGNWVDDDCDGSIDEECDAGCNGQNDWNNDMVIDCSDDYDWWYVYHQDPYYMTVCGM